MTDNRTTYTVAAVGTEGRAEKSLRKGLATRVITDTKRFFIMFVYLAVLFGMINLHEAIVLAQHNVPFTHLGAGLLNAFIFAKVMLVAEDFHLAGGLKDHPLVYPVVFKSILFAVIFMCFHVVERVLIGLWHGQGIVESVPGFGAGGLIGMASVGGIMSVSLIPFFAFREIRRVIGAGQLQSLIFRHGPKDVIVEFKLRTAENK